jgi:FlaA1/EpsC-like NDP-sugar epimerase
MDFRIWLFGLDSFKKRFILITFDVSVSSIALLLAFFIRLETTDYLYRLDTYIGLLIVTFTTLSAFVAQRLYQNVTRHTSIEAAFKIALGCAVSCTVLLTCIVLIGLEVPRSIPLIYAMLFWILSTATRFFISFIDQDMTRGKSENVAIFGTGVNSIQLMEALRKNRNYSIKMFIDDNTKMRGRNIGGVQIFDLNDVAEKIKNLEIQILLLTSPSDIDVLSSRVLSELPDYPLKIKTIPSVTSLISGPFGIAELRDLKIEDLLGREPAQQNPELMAKTIAGKTILVTGAGGSIGSELCRQIIPWKPEKIILLDISEYSIYKLLNELDSQPTNIKCKLIPLIGSVQDRQFIKKVFERFAIDTTYHAAAYKHVPLMEQNVMQCFANNLFGTLNVAEFAIATNVKNFVLVSTDKAVNPTNFMGASKRFAEFICQTLPTKKAETCFSIVRFGNVLGSSGSVVPLFKKQIESGGPITLTHLEITRYFMTIAEASQLVIQAGSIAKGGEVFVLDMGKPIKILELAERMVTLSGLKPILNGTDGLKDDEIAITVTGLRPGEKLFEELAYDPNLVETVHPKIYTTAESPMKRDELEALLTTVGDAIRYNDFQKLYEMIRTIAEGIVGLERSSDVFIERSDPEENNIVPLSRQTKLH